MPRVKMIASTPGSEDGVTINLYSAGQEYDLPDHLSYAFVNHMKTAKYCRVRKPAEIKPTETAVIETAPEIKDISEVILTKEEAKTKETFEEKSEPKIMRVFNLAKILKVPWKDVIKTAKELNIDVKVAQSGLTEKEVKIIKDFFEGK